MKKRTAGEDVRIPAPRPVLWPRSLRLYPVTVGAERDRVLRGVGTSGEDPVEVAAGFAPAAALASVLTKPRLPPLLVGQAMRSVAAGSAVEELSVVVSTVGLVALLPVLPPLLCSRLVVARLHALARAVSPVSFAHAGPPCRSRAEGRWRTASGISLPIVAERGLGKRKARSGEDGENRPGSRATRPQIGERWSLQSSVAEARDLPHPQIQPTKSFPVSLAKATVHRG